MSEREGNICKIVENTYELREGKLAFKEENKDKELNKLINRRFSSMFTVYVGMINKDEFMRVFYFALESTLKDVKELYTYEEYNKDIQKRVSLSAYFDEKLRYEVYKEMNNEDGSKRDYVGGYGRYTSKLEYSSIDVEGEEGLMSNILSTDANYLKEYDSVPSNVGNERVGEMLQKVLIKSQYERYKLLVEDFEDNLQVLKGYGYNNLKDFIESKGIREGTYYDLKKVIEEKAFGVYEGDVLKKDRTISDLVNSFIDEVEKEECDDEVLYKLIVNNYEKEGVDCLITKGMETDEKVEIVRLVKEKREGNKKTLGNKIMYKVVNNMYDKKDELEKEKLKGVNKPKRRTERKVVAPTDIKAFAVTPYGYVPILKDKENK